MRRPDRALSEKYSKLAAGESGLSVEPHADDLRVCLVYPNTYAVGMSSLGFQGVFGLLNSIDGVCCERAFLPDNADMDEFAKTGTSVFSIETQTPLADFDAVFFSVSFENDYINLLRIMALSGLPLRSVDRSGVHPLVAMGGVCAFANPEPVADFMDIVFVGEAEGMLEGFMRVALEPHDRQELLRRAALLEGVYVPGFYDINYKSDGTIKGRVAKSGTPDVIRRQRAADLTGIRSRIVTQGTEFSGMMLVEAMRGCPWACRFCLAGHVFNPPRQKPLEEITAEINQALMSTSRVGLIGPSLGDYRHRREVLAMEGVDFSITSLRANMRSADTAALMARHKSVSIAPEAGSERMRDVINKKISEADILASAEAILKGGVERLRLYFMIGLPTEDMSDVEAIGALIGRIRASSARGIISVTLSTFVPKPFTPFQWMPMLAQKELKKRFATVKKAITPLKGVSLSHDSPRDTALQGVLARGDRRVGAMLEKMLTVDDWRRAADEAGVDAGFYIYRARERLETLPWDFIDNSLDKDDLWAQVSGFMPSAGSEAL